MVYSADAKINQLEQLAAICENNIKNMVDSYFSAQKEIAIIKMKKIFGYSLAASYGLPNATAPQDPVPEVHEENHEGAGAATQEEVPEEAAVPAVLEEEEEAPEVAAVPAAFGEAPEGLEEEEETPEEATVPATFGEAPEVEAVPAALGEDPEVEAEEEEGLPITVPATQEEEPYPQNTLSSEPIILETPEKYPAGVSINRINGKRRASLMEESLPPMPLSAKRRHPAYIDSDTYSSTDDSYSEYDPNFRYYECGYENSGFEEPRISYPGAASTSATRWVSHDMPVYTGPNEVGLYNMATDSVTPFCTITTEQFLSPQPSVIYSDFDVSLDDSFEEVIQQMSPM